MEESEYPGLTPAQEKKLKIVIEGCCELCSEYFAFPFLEIHRISRRRYREMVRDPSTRVLVVCHLCHQHIHRLPVRVKDQRAIVSGRSFLSGRTSVQSSGTHRNPIHLPMTVMPPRCMRSIFTTFLPVRSGWVAEGTGSCHCREDSPFRRPVPVPSHLPANSRPEKTGKRRTKMEVTGFALPGGKFPEPVWVALDSCVRQPAVATWRNTNPSGQEDLHVNRSRQSCPAPAHRSRQRA